MVWRYCAVAHLRTNHDYLHLNFGCVHPFPCYFCFTWEFGNICQRKRLSKKCSSYLRREKSPNFSAKFTIYISTNITSGIVFASIQLARFPKSPIRTAVCHLSSPAISKERTHCNCKLHLGSKCSTIELEKIFSFALLNTNLIIPNVRLQRKNYSGHLDKF